MTWYIIFTILRGHTATLMVQLVKSSIDGTPPLYEIHPVDSRFVLGVFSMMRVTIYRLYTIQTQYINRYTLQICMYVYIYMHHFQH